jgi:rhodanese-related sulfurtransferase
MKKIVTALLAVLFIWPLSVVIAGDAVSIVSKETVKTWMDTGAVTILDARQGRDWTASEFKIITARRVDPRDYSAWKNNYPANTRLVIYCA